VLIVAVKNQCSKQSLIILNIFKKIMTIDDFWCWTLNKLSAGLRADTWYNSQQPYGLAGFINDFSSRMLGYGTLRQLRVRNGIG
jgi:hypothetical protein